MADEARKTGIGIIGDVPWGTHFCHFYRTREDLISILVPYFKTGLENNEFCLWATAEPLGAEEAHKAMEKAVPDFARYVESGQIEIVPHDQWYLQDGSFDSERVIRAWVDKLDRALAAGYSGMRVSGNMSWLEREGFQPFLDYEANMGRVIGKCKMLALCAYRLEDISAADIFEVAGSHTFAVVGRNGDLELVEGALYRKKAEEALRESEKRYRTLIENAPIGIVVTVAGKVVFCNRTESELFGLASPLEVQGRTISDFVHKDDLPRLLEMAQSIRRGEEMKKPVTFRGVRADGKEIVVEGFLPRGQFGEGGSLLSFHQDITERKKAEEELKASEERNRLLIGNANEGVVVIQDEKVVFGNPKYVEISGFSEEEVMSRHFSELVHPDDRQIVVDRYLKRLKGEEIPPTYAARVIDKAGNVKWVEANSVSISWNGRPAILALVTDITERKQAEERTLQEKQFSDTVIDSLPAVFYLIDERGQFVRFNSNMSKVTGYSSEELLRLNALDVIAKEERELVASKIAAVFEKGYENVEAHLLTKRVNRIPYYFTGMRAVIGDRAYLAGMGIDITERRQAEKALRESEAQYRTLFDAMPVVVAIETPEGKVVSVNNAIKELSGYTAEEFMAMNMKDLYVDPGERRRLLALLQKKGSVSGSEVMFRGKDGLSACVLLNMNNLELRGQKLIMTTIRDITAIKQAEIRQRQTSEQLVLASRLASLGLLASGVAHEINNPLAVVMGCAQLVLEKDTPEDVKEDLRLINDSARQMAEVVQRLLAFGRQSKPGKECADINALVSKVLRLRDREMSIRNIEVTTRLDPDLPRTMVDVGQMQQVFLNIILNAEQAIAKANRDGHVLVRTERTDDRITITFRDDGIGITKENLPRLFDPFFTTKDVGEGMGMGLSISYGIVKEHGGRIYAKGAPGKGAAFVVELPIVAKPVQPESDGKPAEEPKEKVIGRILVVDDEPGICQLLRDLLTRDGHSVETVSDASVALEMVKHERFNLILLDIKMKGMTGIDLYQQMGRVAKSLQERVLFITGDTLSGDTRDFLDTTEAPHICKPFDIQQLRKMVNQILWSGRK